MFGFLGTIGHAIESGAQRVADTVQNAVNDARNDPALGALVTNTVNTVRADLAAGVSQLGAGLTNSATRAIAPAGTAPLNIPVTRNALVVGGVGLVLVIALVVLLWRRT